VCARSVGPSATNDILNREYYQAIAPEYARHRRIHPEVLRNLVSTAGLGPASTVLEIGCGTGNYLEALEEVVGCRCWGIDPSEAMLAEARKRAPKAQLLHTAAERLDLSDGQFDLLFAVDVVHHLADRSQAFREGHRTLRANGKLCLVTDSPSIIRRREPLSVYFPETVPVELARYPTPDTLRTELRDAGFLEIADVEVESRSELTDIKPYRARVFSSLRLISQHTFERGMELLEHDFRSKQVRWISRYLLIWGTKRLHPPSSAQ
jgi:ubiquinone/menaquinone biosynthesis C-methylase UbiE